LQRVLALLFAQVICLVASSCCPFSESQPVRPNEVLGWNTVQIGGLDVVCVLLLNKGESSENNNLGVRVVNIIPGDPCAHPGWQALRKVELEFYRPADHHIYGSCITGVGNSLLELESEACISAIGIQEINSKENWVVFDLRK